MKKFAIAFALALTLVVTLLSTGNVSAQGTTPPNAQTPGSGYGRGGTMRNGSGMMAAQETAGEGILHDGMIAVYAEKLGIAVDDLNARLTNGETMVQIAASEGLTAEEFTNLMIDARTQAIDQAVKAGTLTQAQADWMKTRGAGRMGTNGSAGRGAGAGNARGMRGAGTGTPSTCPYLPSTNQ